MSEMLIGTSALPKADAEMMHDAGIGWVRQGFGFPFTDRVGGTLTERYTEAKANAEARAAAKFRILGVTPHPFRSKYEPDENSALQMKWRPSLPEWFGTVGGEEYFANYNATCQWLAEDLRGLVSMWQIANELDLGTFAGPLDLDQAAELITNGARGLKHADPSLVVGHNPAGGSGEDSLYGRLFGRGERVLDYCGADGYYGTWQRGGPQTWADRIAELRELTGAAVLINEWGFSSKGKTAPEGEYPMGVANCETRKWVHTWGAGHNYEGQAAYVTEAFKAFASHRDALLGVFFYRWEDQETCWACGEPDCMVETAWGLVDLQGRAKPSLQAFKEGAAMLCG